jgi:hypothetical protein
MSTDPKKEHGVIPSEVFSLAQRKSKPKTSFKAFLMFLV